MDEMPDSSGVTFVGGKPRSKVVQLEFPVEHAGTTYTSIEVRRMTAGQVADFVDQAREAGREARLPMFYREDGEPVPVEVVDGLDADDAETLNEVIRDFLPRSLRAATE